MPLRLIHASSVAPLLPDILDPLIQRHIRFKLRDSFRVVVPDAESRQDLEDYFLQNEALQGVLIGKSLLTLSGFAQATLLRDPAPLPLASEPLQLTCLQSALRTSRPSWNLDLPQRQRCLRQLRQWERLRSLSGRAGEAEVLFKEYESVLESQGKAWTLERLHQEAWKTLGATDALDLKEVEDFVFLGFRLPEPALTGAIEALLRRYPQMRIHLFLPPEPDILGMEGKFEPWLAMIQAWAAGEVERCDLPVPEIHIQAFPTPLHETNHRIQSWSQHQESTRILVPGGAAYHRVAAQLAPLLGRAGPAPSLLSGDSQVSTWILAALGSALDPEAKLPFAEIIGMLRPLFPELQASLVRSQDLDSLRLLENYRQRLLNWSQAQTLYPETLSLREWTEMLRQDFSELRLAASPASHSYPLRRLAQAGVARSEALFILALNEGVYPLKPGPDIFSEESFRFLELQEERLALRQALHLSQNPVLLSYSHFTVSGRTSAASPFLAEISEPVSHETLESYPLPSPPSQIYFEENVQRESARHFEKILGRDAGNLSNLDLEPSILARFSEQPLSATYLDEFAKCPWRFFAKWHLRLKDEPEEDLEIHARRRGDLLHRLLEATFRSLGEVFFEAGKIPSLAEMEEHFETAFTNLSGELMAMTLPIPPVLRRDQLNRLRQNILGLLDLERNELSESPSRLLPRHTEWSFGGRHAPLRFELDPRRSVPLAGKIDRIDVSEDGRHFLLIDYKSSGSGDFARSLREGRSLQLWIYFHAVSRILYPAAEGVGGLYWDMKELKQNQGMARREAIQPYRHKKIRANSLSFLKDEEFEELQTKIEASLRDLLIKILAGDYGLEPAECLGSRCEFREICRYDDQPR